MIKIRLLSGKVHLMPLNLPEKSPGGIYYDSSRRDDRMQFKILGVGPPKPMKSGTVPALEFYPGQFALVPFLQDSVTLSDGSIVASASQIAAVWD